MRKTKTKYFMFGLVFLLILSVSACGKKREEQIEEENTESVSEFHTEDEVIAEEGTEKGTKGEPDNTEGGTDAVPEESWVNHYYNRGIYFKDGYTYRQFADGLYRRQAGTDSWELLCGITANYGPGLTCYGDRLYFTGYEEEADTQGSGWNNAVFYYDLDTGESGNLLNTGTLTGALNVYDGCLYVQSFALDGGYMVYDGYRLNEEGEILEQLDSEAEDFLCREQNEYSIAEYELMQGPVSGRRSSGTSIDKLKEETSKATKIIGRIKKLESSPDVQTRTTGKITVVYLDEAEQRKTVTIKLEKADYDKAIEAHEKGSHVEIIGELLPGKRPTMECESFGIID